MRRQVRLSAGRTAPTKTYNRSVDERYEVVYMLSLVSVQTPSRLMRLYGTEQKMASEWRCPRLCDEHKYLTYTNDLQVLYVAVENMPMWL